MLTFCKVTVLHLWYLRNTSEGAQFLVKFQVRGINQNFYRESFNGGFCLLEKIFVNILKIVIFRRMILAQDLSCSN